MPRKLSKKTLRNKLDKAWSRAILSKGKCEICGKKESLNAHHIVGRRNLVLRWDLKNGVCLCAGCHTFKTLSAHQNPEFFHFWLEEHRWEDLRDVNCIMYNIRKWSLEEMQGHLEFLNNFNS